MRQIPEELILNIGRRPAIDYIAKELGKGLVGAEIGVNRGYNAAYICDKIEPKMLYLIDPWDNFLDPASGEIIGEVQYITAKEILSAYSCCKFIRKSSYTAIGEFPPSCLDFIYIDSDHSVPAVLREISQWYPVVKNGGILSGHDFTTNSVREAVLFFCEKYKIKQINTECEDWWWRKA